MNYSATKLPELWRDTAFFQGAIFSVSNVFIQTGINSFGENAIAGSSPALNFEYFTYDIANAFAQAAVSRIKLFEPKIIFVIEPNHSKCYNQFKF